MKDYALLAGVFMLGMIVGGLVVAKMCGIFKTEKPIVQAETKQPNDGDEMVPCC